MSGNRLIRDAVVPLASGRWDGSKFDYSKLAGTAFLIGRRGFAVTAAHVVDQVNGDVEPVVACFVNSANNWVPTRVKAFEKHPTEDVAVAQLEEMTRGSWLVLTDRSEHQSRDYDLWGYPISVAELSAKYKEHGLEKPDLVYTRGYVRRRISEPLPTSIYRGSSFYELSDLGGNGCSGGPVIDHSSVGNPAWRVFGVYVGECNAGFSAGYAVRSDAFYAWIPALIGRSVRDESQDTLTLGPSAGVSSSVDGR